MDWVLRQYNHRKIIELARHPAFAVWSAVFIGADMTSPVALYLPLWACLTWRVVKKRLEAKWTVWYCRISILETVFHTIYLWQIKYLKGQSHDIFELCFFTKLFLLEVPENKAFFSQRYSNLKMTPWCTHPQVFVQKKLGKVNFLNMNEISCKYYIDTQLFQRNCPFKGVAMALSL